MKKTGKVVFVGDKGVGKTWLARRIKFDASSRQAWESSGGNELLFSTVYEPTQLTSYEGRCVHFPGEAVGSLGERSRMSSKSLGVGACRSAMVESQKLLEPSVNFIKRSRKPREHP